MSEFRRGKSKTSKAKTPWVYILLGIILPAVTIFVGCAISAYLFAAEFDFQSHLGTPLFYFYGKPVYPPWMFIGWLVKYNEIAYGETYIRVLAETSDYAKYSAFISFFLILVTSLTRPRKGKVKNLFGTARWGKESDLRKKGLLAKTGCVFGQLNGAEITTTLVNDKSVMKTVKRDKIVRFNGPSSTWVIAPPRSGKGVSVICPTLFDFFGSVIVLDMKGENWNITAGYRRQFSHVLRLSFTDKNTIRFNPLMMMHEKSAFRDAQLIADILLTPKADKNSESSTAEHFRESARDFLTGCILHVLCSEYSDKTLGGVLDLISISGIKSVENLGANSTSQEIMEAFNKSSYDMLINMINCKHTNETIHRHVKGSAARAISKDVRERSGVFSTVFKALLPFEDPMIRHVTSGHDFNFSMFATSENPVSLYICVPYSDVERLSAMIRIFVTMGVKYFSEGETIHGDEKLKNKLLFLLDEFPAVGRFPMINEAMAVLPGYGITFMLICQSLNQIVNIYGEKHSFWDLCKIVCAFAPGDKNTAELFSQMCGKESIMQEGDSHSGKKLKPVDGGYNVSLNERERNLINADEIMKMGDDETLIFCQGAPPYVGKKVLFYDDKRYKHKAGGDVPGSYEELLQELPDIEVESKWYDLPSFIFYDEEVESSEEKTSDDALDKMLFDMDDDTIEKIFDEPEGQNTNEKNNEEQLEDEVNEYFKTFCDL